MTTLTRGKIVGGTVGILQVFLFRGRWMDGDIKVAESGYGVVDVDI